MITIRDIEIAAKRLDGLVFKTPLIESEWLNHRLGGRVLFKAECLQKTGSFKIRGASNKLHSLSAEEASRGVVAYSSGNHAQGVAAAAKNLGIKATIIIPRDAPSLKIENTRADGATIVLYDRYGESREAIAADIAAKEGYTIIPPYDDDLIIAGQGSIGLEILEQTQGLGLKPDVVLCPCGGGGLMAGLSTAIKPALPHTDIYAIEPVGFDDTRRSLEADERKQNESGGSSICDAIVTPTPGEITFQINRQLLTGGLAVSDESVIDALVTAYTRLKLVVEPGGAVGLAALLSGVYQLNGKTAVVVLSGGNIDIATLVALFQSKV